MNPYAQFGPLLSYSHKTNKQGQGAVRILPVDDEVNSGPFKNLVLCITRRSTGVFVTTVRKVISDDKCMLFVSVMDGVSHQSTMVAEFNTFVFRHFAAQGEPANIALVVEDPALLEEAVRSGLIEAYMRSSVVGTNLSTMTGRPPILHVFLSNIAGLGNVNKSLAVCRDLKVSLADSLPCPELEVVMNSLLEPESGGYSTVLQEHTWLYFDKIKFNENNFSLDESEIAESLRGKLAFVQDLKALLSATRLSLILGDLGTLEATYSTLQDKVLRGDIIRDPESLRDVVVLEQKIRSLLDVLDIPPPTQTGNG